MTTAVDREPRPPEHVAPQDVPESSYVERFPARAVAAVVSSVWVQQAGAQTVTQRHVPHGGAEVRCVLGDRPQLLGPLTTSTYQRIPPGRVVVGVRLRPGALGRLAGVPADELVDLDIPVGDVWSEQNRLLDVLGAAATPWTAVAALQSFVVRSAVDLDPLVTTAVRNLMPWQHGGPATLPALLSISERQLRRRCRAAVGLGPKELHRILRFQSFTARVQESVAGHDTAGVDLARWAAEAGYHDQAHLSRECRKLSGVTPGEYLTQARANCRSGHDHVASYAPMLPRGDGRIVQERQPRCS